MLQIFTEVYRTWGKVGAGRVFLTAVAKKTSVKWEEIFSGLFGSA